MLFLESKQHITNSQWVLCDSTSKSFTGQKKEFTELLWPNIPAVNGNSVESSPLKNGFPPCAACKIPLSKISPGISHSQTRQEFARFHMEIANLFPSGYLFRLRLVFWLGLS